MDNRLVQFQREASMIASKLMILGVYEELNARLQDVAKKLNLISLSDEFGNRRRESTCLFS